MALHISVRVESNLGKIARALSVKGGIKVQMRPVLRKAQRLVANTAKSKYLRGPRPARLAPRSGALIRSIKTPEPRRTPWGLEAEVVADSRYARMHEEGGVIRPKRAKFLAIPLVPGLTSPRNQYGTFVFRASSGKLIIARRSPGGGLEPLYVLKKQVKIPDRPFLKPALEDNRARIEKMIARAYFKSMRGMFGR